MGFGIYSQDWDEEKEMMVASCPGIIRLKKMETRDQDLALFLDLVSMSREGVSQLNTRLSPTPGELQRRINKTKRPAFAERPATSGGPVIPLAFSPWECCWWLLRMVYVS